MITYKTKEEARNAAIREHGKLSLETGVVQIVMIGTTAAKFLKCEPGYSYE